VGDNTWELGTLTPKASGSIIITVRAAQDAAEGSPLLNTATLTGNGLITQISTAAVLVSQPGLELIKTPSVPHVQPGQLLTFTVTFTNASSRVATGVRLTDTYDAHTTFYAARPNPDFGDNVWEIGTVSPTASGKLTISVRVTEQVPNGSVLLNRASLWAHDLETTTALAYVPVTYFRFFLPIILDQ
jgi:uncharacterized repeat protein (TIGR01451 family)